MTDILLSAFEPFGDATINASEQVLERLMQRPEWQGRVQSAVLPVTRGLAEESLLATLAQRTAASLPTRLVVALGEAGPEPIVRLEMVALNFDDFRIPDNGGNQPRHQTIISDGPRAYFTPLPLQVALAALEGKTPLPIRLSLSAGAFVCNHLYYTISHALQSQESVLPFVFIHLPKWRPESGEEALDAIVETVAQLVEDLNNLAEPDKSNRPLPEPV